MSYNRPKVKLDANHAEITDYLRDHRFLVEDFSASGGKVDLFVSNRELSAFGFLEIKVETSRARYTKAQLKWVSGTPFNIAFVKNKEQALEFALNPREKGLTQAQKDRLSGLLLLNRGKAIFLPSEVEKAIYG
jgi:hypothetical protein